MVYSAYLGSLKPFQFASWQFEKPLKLSESILANVVLDSYLMCENADLIKQVDLFVSQVHSAKWENTFKELTAYLYYQFIVKKGYVFDKHNCVYTAPFDKISPVQLWDYLKVDIVVLLNEDSGEWSFKFDVSGFGTSVYVLFTTTGLFVGRDVRDWDLSMDTEYKLLPSGMRLYFSEDVYMWVSTQVINTSVWGIIGGCRLYIEEDVLAIEGIEQRIDNCIQLLKKKEVEEVFLKGASRLEISFNYTWQDYDKEYQEDLVLERASEDRSLLRQLVAPPSRIEVALKEGRLILIHYNDCYWEDEYGIHFIYDEELNLLAINEGNYYDE
ncbi:hypothetical protein [Myroides pelagicus]|uniref:DUF2262 domain-containing protein n=1 Tax=Myroides pelagicus TaxID=270914 RepID=A0A7K1GN72_9FLAO|nr:hypothetical protein [Myroides pelagicus]MEC4113074.1 hypothetical protein [Myroides pelagicus]MTH29979.1 hypothetical protein [Myroides pelagicus]